MSSKTAEHIIQGCEALERQRDPWVPLWEDALRYCLPAHAELHRDGEKSQPPDTTGVRAAQLLASGLISNSVARGREWFALRASRDELNESTTVKRWFAEVTRAAHEAMTVSDFAQKVHEALLLYVCTGTGILSCELSKGGRLRFRSFPVNQGVSIAEDPDGRVDTLYRRYPLSAKQLVQRYGADKVSPKTLAKVKRPDGQLEDVEIITAVYPLVPGADRPAGTPEGATHVSVHVEVEEKHVLREGHFASFPFCVFRFMTVGNEVYGRSPAMAALPDLRLLARAVLDVLDAAEMAVQPPVFLPAGTQENVDMRPGAVNYYDANGGGRPYWVDTARQVQLGMDFLDRFEERVLSIFMVDLFMALEDRKNMTATEVAERITEKIQSITPVVARLQSELFEPCVQRVVELLVENAQVDPPPPELAEEDYTIVYTSRLDSRIKAVDNEHLRNAIMLSGELLEAKAKAGSIELDTLYKWRKVLRTIAENFGVLTEHVNTEEEADRATQEIRDEEERARNAEMLASRVAPVDLNRAPEPGSVLDPETMEAAANGGAVMP